MEKENNKSKSISALIWVAIFLTLFGIVIAIIYAGARLPALRKLLVFAGYAMVIFYGAYGYRQPHGNLLRSRQRFLYRWPTQQIQKEQRSVCFCAGLADPALSVFFSR